MIDDARIKELRELRWPTGHEVLHELLDEIERLRPFRDAITQRHNGYNTDARAAMPELKEPESPQQALDELLMEERDISEQTSNLLQVQHANDLEKEIVRLRECLRVAGLHALGHLAEIERLRAKCEERKKLLEYVTPRLMPDCAWKRAMEDV